MKSQINKIFYFKEHKLMSRIVKVLYFKGSKDNNVFNIDVRRLILVYSDNARCDKTYIVSIRRFARKCFRNKSRFCLIINENYFYKCHNLTRS